MEKEIEPAQAIEVLLATYNGDRYLASQIDSILGQTYPNITILAWDDGSSDDTETILEEYASRFKERIRVLSDGVATGHPKRNFQRLLKASTEDYVCFADQDDIWLPEKLSASMEAMRRLEQAHGKSTPLLVFTDLRVVDGQLRAMHPSLWKQAGLRVENIHRLARVVGENVVTGCTALINRSMRDLAIEMPEEAIMHDSWIALLAAAFGSAAPVPKSTVLYRQHGNNAVGSTEQDSSFTGLASRAVNGNYRRLLRSMYECQAEAFLRVYRQRMTDEQKRIVEAYLLSGRSESAWKRIVTTMRYRFYRSGFLKNVATIADLVRGRSSDSV